MRLSETMRHALRHVVQMNSGRGKAGQPMLPHRNRPYGLTTYDALSYRGLIQFRFFRHRLVARPTRQGRKVLAALTFALVLPLMLACTSIKTTLPDNGGTVKLRAVGANTFKVVVSKDGTVAITGKSEGFSEGFVASGIGKLIDAARSIMPGGVPAEAQPIIINLTGEASPEATDPE